MLDPINALFASSCSKGIKEAEMKQFDLEQHLINSLVVQLQGNHLLTYYVLGNFPELSI
jgi:hypothetical protein